MFDFFRAHPLPETFLCNNNSQQFRKKLTEYVNHFSAIGLTGPRQSGKSTLLLHQLKDYQYVTFDDFRTVALYHDDPNKFMRIYSNKIIFDEVQKVPELYREINATRFLMQA